MSNGIVNSLTTSARALSTYSRAIQVAGNNIANLGTPGYARQVVVTGPRDYYDGGDAIRNTGVEIIQVRQVRDQVLDAQILREAKTNGSLNAQKTIFDLMEATLGETLGRTSGHLGTLDGSPEDNLGGSGLSKTVEDFFGAWHELSATPELTTTKGVVLQNAEVLVDQFHVLDQRLEELDAEIIRRIQNDAEAATILIDKIGDINDSIARLEVANTGNAIELRSERQRLLEELSQYMDFEVRESEKNKAMVDLFVTAEASGNDIHILSGDQRYTDLTYDGNALMAGTPPVAVDLTNGSIQGYHSARQNELTDFRTQLDTLARQVVTSVNAAYNPTDAAGEYFFDPAGITAASIALAVTDPVALRTVDVGVTTGGNTIALAVAALTETTFTVSGGDFMNGSFSDYVIGLGTTLGQHVDSATSRLEAQETVQKHLLAQRDAVGGVNLDEEVANMMKFQRSYQAMSRVIAVLDEMLASLVNQL